MTSPSERATGVKTNGEGRRTNAHLNLGHGSYLRSVLLIELEDTARAQAEPEPKDYASKISYAGAPQ